MFKTYQVCNDIAFNYFTGARLFVFFNEGKQYYKMVDHQDHIEVCNASYQELLLFLINLLAYMIVIFPACK